MKRLFMLHLPVQTEVDWMNNDFNLYMFMWSVCVCSNRQEIKYVCQSGFADLRFFVFTEKSQYHVSDIAVHSGKQSLSQSLSLLQISNL